MTFYDSRHDDYCSYCGNRPDTRDHVPSKILLEKPFPENLPVVPCCYECNNQFSLDEEYVACIFECLIQKSCEIEDIKNDRIKKILTRKIKLQNKIRELFFNNNIFQILTKEENRIKNILIKLAKGHYKYEYGEPIFEQPDIINISILENMNKEDSHNFFSNNKQILVPEIGSRNFINIFKNKFYNWIEVQENIYSYLIFNDKNNFHVRMLIRNYFACEVIWYDNY